MFPLILEGKKGKLGGVVIKMETGKLFVWAL